LSGRNRGLLKGIKNAEWVVVPPALYVSFHVYETMSPFGFIRSEELFEP
jgi:hypothetical protein